jgi:DNA repair protein RadA/Sms
VEAQTLGFKRVFVPYSGLDAKNKVEGIEIIGVKTLSDALRLGLDG